jgi:biofilm protein TabA
MIVDELKNASQYAATGTPLRRALDYLMSTDLLSLAPGRNVVDGDTIYVERQQYPTRPIAQGRYEAHRKYLDVHVILQGREKIYWAPVGALTVTDEYSAQKDALMLSDPAGSGDANSSRLQAQLGPGSFAIVFPQDAHIPGSQWDGETMVEKVVVKVLWSAPA